MYTEKFEFLIVSKNLEIEQALQEVEPLEDSVYHFETYSETAGLSGERAWHNTAVIIDGGVVTEQLKENVSRWVQEKESGREAPFTAVIIQQGKTELTSGCCRKVDHIWIIDTPDDTEALKVYFAKLAVEMKEKADAVKQEICFRTLIDSARDLIWFKDVDGRHLIVNDEFCRFVNKNKGQIYKQGHCYIWNASEEDEKVCLESDREIIIGRETRKFEEQVHTNGEDYIIQSYKSPLIQRGEIFGTCGIGQNITSERNLEKKLQAILDHIPFAVAVVSKEGVLNYKNRMFDTYFPEVAGCLGANADEVKRQLHFPEHLEEGKTAELEIQGGDEEPVWLSYCEKTILDAFDLQVEKMLVIQDITANKKLEIQKDQMACSDYLTGLANRRGMLRTLENENDLGGLTVILIDIDDFKLINDSFGHSVGDEVLKEFAKVLKKVFVADMVIRYGGDEFLIITRLYERDVICAKLESLSAKAEDVVYGDGSRGGISVSGGISVRAEAGIHTIEDLIEMSDEAMYYIKKHGKNGYCFYDERIRDK